MADARATAPAVNRQPKDLLTLAKGGGFMMGGGFIEFVFRIGIAWILARALGASGYGLYSLVVGVAGLVVGIGGLGLDDAMVRYLAIQTNRRDAAGMRGTLQIGIAGAVVVGVAAGFGLFLLSGWIANDLFEEPELVFLLQFTAATVPILLLSNVLLGVTRGFNRMDYAAFAENVLQTVVRFALLGALWFIRLDVVTAVVAFALADLTATLVLIGFVRRLVSGIHLPREAPRREYGQVLGFAVPLWISGLLNRFRRNIETFVLGVFSIAADVGIFSVAARINFVAHMLYRSVVVAVKPLLARAYADEDRTALGRIYSAATRWTFTLNLPLFVVTVLYAREILAVFGPDFEAGVVPFVLLALSELSLAATGTCGSMIDMAGHTTVKVVNSVLWVVLAVGLSLLLIPPYGVVGAALASMVSVALVNLVRTVEVWVLDGLQPYRRDFWKPVVAGVIAALVGLALRTTLGTGGMWWVLQGSVVGLLYLGLLTRFGVHDEDREILGRVGHKLRRLSKGRR